MTQCEETSFVDMGVVNAGLMSLLPVIQTKNFFIILLPYNFHVIYSFCIFIAI